MIRPNGTHTPLFGNITSEQACKLLGVDQVDVYTTRHNTAMFIKDTFVPKGPDDDVKELNPFAMSLYGTSPIFGSVVVIGHYCRQGTRSVRDYSPMR
jgi:hypothetical protein